MKRFELRRVAAELNGTIIGDADAVIAGAAAIDEAEEGDLVFAESARFLQSAAGSRAAAILVTPDLAGACDIDKPLIVVSQPRVAFAQALRLLAPPQSFEPGIHELARVAEGARVGARVHIAANVVIGRDSIIEDDVILLPGVCVGDRCSIGAGTIVHPNAVLYSEVKVGRACILHAGCIIGSDGFGYVPMDRGLMKIPQLGTVEIGDAVEIGANSCIDRAKTGVTRIGSGTKIDNLVHIAHNVTVGLSCLIIAQTGVAGSVTIGNGVVLAGQAGIKDHVTLGDGARVGAQGGVIGDVPAGVTVSGYPARPHQEKMRELGALTSLPDALKRLRALEKRMATYEAGFYRANRNPNEPDTGSSSVMEPPDSNVGEAGSSPEGADPVNSR